MEKKTWRTISSWKSFTIGKKGGPAVRADLIGWRTKICGKQTEENLAQKGGTTWERRGKGAANIIYDREQRGEGKKRRNPSSLYSYRNSWLACY